MRRKRRRFVTRKPNSLPGLEEVIREARGKDGKTGARELLTPAELLDRIWCGGGARNGNK